MTITSAMVAHLAGSPTTLCPVWKMTALDGTVVAYCGHTRRLVIGDVIYKAVAADFSRSKRKIGLEPNTSDLTAPFDEAITEADIYGGKWKHARIEKQWVNYFDLSMGGVYQESGFAGKFSVTAGQSFTVEFLSLSSQLRQEIGDVTSPTDQRVSIAELAIDPAPYTHERAITAAGSRRQFTVDGSPQADGYFRYGLAVFTSGDNEGLRMEIKNNVGNVISLQLGMPYEIAVSDAVTLVRGYDGTRESAKTLDDAINFRGFPDLPGLNSVLRFPQ
jgi:uncharacterized phage protein (TIGR02218 family)